MKKLLLLIAIVLLGFNTTAQNDLYLLFEFMKVENSQEQAYWETESFWEKIHIERAKNGDILGWDLWTLKPGGTDQGYQYLTVNLYDDPVKMFNNSGDFDAALKAAYPEATEEELNKKFKKTANSRSLGTRLYIHVIKQTTGEFDMPIGTVASIDFMKAERGNDYVKAEIETFYPLHQQAVEAGAKGYWGLARVMSPSGTDVYANFLTVNMYSGFDQMFNSNAAMWNTERSDEDQKKIQEGVNLRDMRKVYLGTLVKKVRR